jgi:hypothetical protein
VQALEREVAARWPWVRRLRLSVVRTNDNVLGFWHRTGFAETGEVRPWRYDKLQSEAILLDRRIPADPPGGPTDERGGRP